MRIEELKKLWDTDEGKPYKGCLIEPESIDGGIGCMCAQGQVLHFVGGWERTDLIGTNQFTADIEVARLLDIPIVQSVLLRKVNDSVDGAPRVVLDEPEKILGENASEVIAFWRHIDSMTSFERVSAKAKSLDDVVDFIIGEFSELNGMPKVITGAVWWGAHANIQTAWPNIASDGKSPPLGWGAHANIQTAWPLASAVVSGVVPAAACYATLEIQRQEQEPEFLPLFGFDPWT